MSSRLILTALAGLPIVKPGDDLGQLIADSIKQNGVALSEKDIVVVTSKIVSKAEGRLVEVRSVVPTEQALRIAQQSGKNPKIVELMLREGKVVEVKPGVIVTLHRLGFVCTSAGIDGGNTGEPERDYVSLLPEDPDASAQRIRQAIEERLGIAPGVIINDSFGVEYRVGSMGMAIGVAGMPAIIHDEGKGKDLYGNKRNVNISFADEISAAASLLMGQAAEGIPVVVLQGLEYPSSQGKLLDLIATEQIKRELGKE